MIITVLNYNTGSTHFYNYSGNLDSHSIETWLKETHNHQEDEISWISTEDLNYYIDPNIYLNLIKPINE